MSNRSTITPPLALPEEAGIVSLTAVVDSLFAIAVSAVDTFKDGLQVGDVKFLPEAIKHVVIISRNVSQATVEAKDLDAEEIGALLGSFAAKLMYLFKEPDKLLKG